MRYTDKVPGMLLEKVATDRYFQPTRYAMAAFFGVSYDTIGLWKRTHKAFAEAVEKANELVCESVQSDLLKRLKGYDIIEEREETTDADGTKRIKTHRHIPAEPSLVKYYLNNRDPDHWSDKQEVHQTGQTTTTVIVQESDVQVL